MNFLDSLRMKLSIAKSYQYSGKDYRVKNLQTLIEQNLGYVLFKQIEKVKIDLTRSDDAIFEFNESEISINEPISIQAFSKEIIKKNSSLLVLSIKNHNFFNKKNKLFESSILELLRVDFFIFLFKLKLVFFH
jgi:hypothetical protein